ncbi:hypothetical protein GCM10018790_63580 [Kitasatospora xanthocidica]|uniref:abortive infection family protein n=1 Tax=Kitasatospora xanthocidica TaxID=83382 RepID=UPI0016719423|nr:abortive infection family protein [Kitasatospora xanthocidica]GHF76766.1 hypothetical protein GCM10018790_63580 [Kitasatospora xanthocidica]
MIHRLTDEPLPRAQWLREESWGAITDAYNRLRRAAADNDRPLLVGSAKELVESVSRVTLAAAGKPSGDNADYLQVLTSAHKTVEHAIGPELAGNDPLRQIPDAARRMASQLRELRNRFGTGHGRAVVHTVTDEVVEASVHGALIWTRWALARLHIVLLGAVQPLISGLLDGESFYSGDLTQRLTAANITKLDEPEQRALGLAVGQRAARATFNVRIEGIEAVAKNPSLWPDPYREAALQGLFINPDGQVFTDPDHSAPSALVLLRDHTAPDRAVNELRALLTDSSWSVEFQYRPTATVTSMEAVTSQIPATAQQSWQATINDLKHRAGL